MTFESIVPVLYSADVVRSLAYYTEQLAFDDSRTWDETAVAKEAGRNNTKPFAALYADMLAALHLRCRGKKFIRRSRMTTAYQNG